MTATFGDFLDRAVSRLSEAASVHDLPSSTVIASTVQIRRLVTALSRYVADPRTFPEPADSTTIGVRLYQAATSLRRAADAGSGLAGPGAAHPLPSRIAGAATGLIAGLDLLATHHATSQDGTSVPLSPWAPALASSPARAMLLAELADLAVLAGSSCRALATVPSPALPQASRNALLAASGQLTSVRYVPHQGPGHPLAAYRQLLHAAPSAITPARQPAGPPEGLDDLSQAISLSAERIRSLTWQSRTARAWPPPPGLAAWRWSAHAAAIADHICELIVTGLAERAGQFMPSGTAPALSGAAAVAGISWNAWRQAASMCGTLTDAVAWNTPSPARDDLTDLIIRLGRIAYDNPQWTPAISRRAPLRAPADLAPGPAEFRMLLAAVHDTADALTHIASADLAAVRAAVSAGRVREEIFPVAGQAFMASRLSDLPRAYEIATQAASRAAEVVDQLAITAHAPSSHLAVIRAALTPRPTPARTGADDPGQPRARLLAAGHEVRRHQIAALVQASFPDSASPTTGADQAHRQVASAVRARSRRIVRLPCHGAPIVGLLRMQGRTEQWQTRRLTGMATQAGSIADAGSVTSWQSLLYCAQADVTIERVRNLIAVTGTEPVTVEFKESATPRIAECAAAMANTYGGLVFVGVTDADREIVGVPREVIGHISGFLADLLDPPGWLTDVFEVPLGEENPDRYVVVIRVRREEAPRPVFVQATASFSGEKRRLYLAPVRRPGGTRQATRDELDALFAERAIGQAPDYGWELNGPQMPRSPDGHEDPAVDLVLRSGLRVRVGVGAMGRPISQKAADKLGAALSRSPLTDFLLALTARSNSHAESFRYEGHNRSNVINLAWRIHGQPGPFETRAELKMPGHYGHSDVTELELTLTVISRLSAWLNANQSSEPPPPRKRRLEVPEWAGLLGSTAATLASPEIVGPVADIAGIDPLELRQPRVLHIRSGPPMPELLPAELTPIPDTGTSQGAHMLADPALDLNDRSERDEQVDSWLCQIAADAGLRGMEDLVARWRLEEPLLVRHRR